MPDGVFRLQENRTNARTEVLAGLTTFVTMVRITSAKPLVAL
jgi:AGZA family xanthine/uracil permease-like MFS transporter